MKVDKFDEFVVVENRRIVAESYVDYLNDDGDKQISAIQIRRTANAFVKYRGSELHDWIEQFKNEELVINELKKLQ